ncbi:hypothetical protein [Ekhidna sp.]|uniref:hypothetical protein n=1 Tax=Ekhidna sp. TaxID=2608089 RepID=UPI003B513BD2
MNKLPFLFLFFVLFSCEEKDTINFEYGQKEYVYDRSGKQYDLDPNKIYCGPGFGRKFCRFLYKYEETIWADAENYYSDFSDIKFSGFADDLYFLSFLNLDSTTSYCEGWKLGETTYDGIKWNIELKKDEDDVLWFGYDYYGISEEIEYSITYKYEVIDGLLHFSSSEDQTFIFHPSEKNYSEDSVETGEIIFLEGCKFF